MQKGFQGFGFAALPVAHPGFKPFALNPNPGSCSHPPKPYSEQHASPGLPKCERRNPKS